MSRSYTPKYMVRIKDQSGPTEMAWNCKSSGRPSDKNAERFRQAMNRSVQPGEVNDHLRVFGTGVPHFSDVEIRINRPHGPVVAKAKAPMFEVV